jgi:hypothetical protein
MALDEFYSVCAIPKVYRPKKPTTKGPTAKRRERKHLAAVRISSKTKREVRALDGDRCRWPECEVPPNSFWGSLEVAHYRAAGMGGDPQQIRTTPAGLLCLCRWHHQGPHGLHSGDAKLEPLTTRGMRGPVACYQRERGEGKKWFVVGVTKPPKVGTS